MGAIPSTATNNFEMVGNLVKEKYIRSVRQERAFRAVDRAHFFPDFVDATEFAFNDNAWRHGQIHISSPCIYSEAMERLDLQPGHSFLNLGSGTGYLSTIAGHLLGANGLNHGVELYPEVVEYAREHVASFVKKSYSVDMYEFCMPKFVVGNFLLLPKGTQYDRIYCGAACTDDDIYHYLKGLLKVDGKLIVPFNSELMLVRRISKSRFAVRSLLSVAFSEIQLVTPATNFVPVLPLPEVHSLKVHCRTLIRSAIRQQIHQKDPQIQYRNSLIYWFDRTSVPLTPEDFPSSMIPMRVKLDSGIVEDLYIDGFEGEAMDESEDTDSNNSVASFVDDTYAHEFSVLMESCIKKLELPRTLKEFLNLNREFL